MSERIVTPSQEDKWFDYIYLGGILIGRIDSQVNGEANVYAYHNDHLGTPLIMTDNNQEVVWAADYEPFGSAWVTTHTVESNIRFPGQYYDDESGMHYNWHRYYQPEFGAYVQADPLSLRQVVSFSFSYAKSNPLKITDSKGLVPEEEYKDLFLAVADALRESLILSLTSRQKWEYGGWIYKYHRDTCSTYSYTAPKTSRENRTVYKADYAQPPEDTTIIADYHVHSFMPDYADDPRIEPFSIQDEDSINFNGYPGFLAVLGENTLFWKNSFWLFQVGAEKPLQIHISKH